MNTDIEAPTIPEEIFDAILNLVHDHPATLESCALVSRGFTETSQRHLFSTIKIDAPTLSQIKSNPCSKFYNIICESPHLAAYVRQFSIVDGYHDVRGAHSTCRYAWLSAATERLPKVLSQLVNLQHLSIQGSSSTLGWENLPTKIQNAFLATIGRPQLSWIELTNTSGFLHLLKCATNLKSVYLFNSSHSPRTPHPLPTLGVRGISKPHLLEISGNMDLPIGDDKSDSWLDPSALRSLTLQCHTTPSKADGNFLKRFFTSRTLEHIQLHLPSPMPFMFLTDLSIFRDLRTFFIDFRGNGSTHRLEYASWLIQLINTIPDTTCIETIAFQLSRRSPDDLLLFEEYAKLDAALARPGLRSLRSVRVKVAIMAIPAAYYRRMPLVSARGILQVEPGARWVTTKDPGCPSSCNQYME